MKLMAAVILMAISSWGAPLEDEAIPERYREALQQTAAGRHQLHDRHSDVQRRSVSDEPPAFEAYCELGWRTVKPDDVLTDWTRAAFLDRGMTVIWGDMIEAAALSSPESLLQMREVSAPPHYDFEKSCRSRQTGFSNQYELFVCVYRLGGFYWRLHDVESTKTYERYVDPFDLRADRDRAREVFLVIKKREGAHLVRVSCRG